MTKQNKIGIAVSQEELLMVLKYLKVDKITGLDMDVFTQLSDQEMQMVLGVAERALLARGFLKIGTDKKLKLEPVPMGVIGTCVKSDRTIVINHQEKNKLDLTYFFHYARSMRVVHFVPISAIHQFLAVETTKDFLRMIFSLLGSNEFSKNNIGSFSLSQTAFDRAKELAQNGSSKEAILTEMEKVKLNNETATSFVDSLIDPLSNTAFISRSENNGTMALSGFTILKGHKAVWLLKPDPQEQQISIEPIDSVDLNSIISTLFAD